MSGYERLHAPLCLILLTYTAPLEAVDAAMADHVAWLERGFAEGLFIVCGRKVPRDGGVILTRGHRAEVEALAASDPFVIAGVARAEVIEFGASMAAPALAGLIA